MQQQKTGPSIDERQLSSIFNTSREMIVKVKAFKRGLDYPCGCRHCLELRVSSSPLPANSLAAIDVYDVPDAIEVAPDYFH